MEHSITVENERLLSILPFNMDGVYEKVFFRGLLLKFLISH